MTELNTNDFGVNDSVTASFACRYATVLGGEDIAIGSAGSLRQDEVDLLLNQFYRFAKDDDANVRAVDTDKLLQVLALQEQPWDDDLRILLNGRPVDELSPGGGAAQSCY